MNVAHLFHEGLPWLVAGGVGFAAWKVGRRWRRQYTGAIAHHSDLHAENEAQAEALAAMRAELAATATASGNVVVIGRDDVPAGVLDRLTSASGQPGVRPPGAIRGGSDRGPVVREALTGERLGFSFDVERLGYSRSDQQLADGGDADAGDFHGRGLRPLDG